MSVNPWTFETSFEVLKSLKRLKRGEVAHGGLL
jgi:hypothetical protein